MENCKKMGVLAGCNYPGTESELQGPINDVSLMYNVLIQRFGFEAENIEFMTDAPDSEVHPTGANIKAALVRMFERAEEGDILFFHFSGHGTQIPSEDGVRADEAIVPCDFNVILDDDFRTLVNCLPKGATFTFLSDSCHSGGLIDKEKEQIGPHTTPTLNITSNSNPDFQYSETKDYKPKHLPFHVLVQVLQSLTNHETSDIATHLDAHFGEDASAKYRRLTEAEELYERLHPDMGILLSGCQPEELSIDIPEDETYGARGALSAAVQVVLQEYEGPISNRDLAILVREKLKEAGFSQNPCLYCSDDNADAAFLGQTE